MPDDRPDELSPETADLLMRLMKALALTAGLLLGVAFVLGVVREGVARWWMLALAVPFLAAPWVPIRLGE